MPVQHEIAIPFQPDYPEVMAVCCSDGRYIEAVGKFLADRGVARHDLLALPGGPGLLCPSTASVYQKMVALEAFDFLVESHHTRRLILIGHEQCGYYRQRLGACDEARQIEDLRRVRQAMLKRHPRLEVAMYFARPRRDDPAAGFTLEEVADERA